MRLIIILLASWLIGCAPAPAQDWAGDWAGDWVWRIEDKPAMVLRLDGSGRGQMIRPRNLTLDANAGYWRMIDASAELATIGVTPIGPSDGGLRLRAVDPERAETTDYTLTRSGGDGAELSLTDIPVAPSFTLVRAPGPTTVATDWSPGRAYGGPPVFDDNDELTRLFAEDQAARQGTTRLSIGTGLQDAERRVVVRRMLDTGKVRSAADHYHAAFIFQHGDQSDDYLLAHALAVSAVARGRDDAAWIAAATLDRYLHSIGRPQIYGTQFQIRYDGSGTTQGDFDRTLIPDSLRITSGVPPLAAQAEQLRAYDRTD